MMDFGPSYLMVLLATSCNFGLIIVLRVILIASIITNTFLCWGVRVGGGGGGRAVWGGQTVSLPEYCHFYLIIAPRYCLS